MMRFSKCIVSSVLFASTAWVSFAWAGPVTLEIINFPDQKWHFLHLSVSPRDQGWVVSGRLNSRSTGLPMGHVDLAAFGPDRRLLAETTAAYSPGVLTPKTRKKGGVHFSAVFPESLPEGTLIKVAFHRDMVASSGQKPAHETNIAAVNYAN